MNVKEIKSNGNSISNANELAEAFNNHFATIGPKLASKISNGGRPYLKYLDCNLRNLNSFELKQVNLSTVHSLISKLNQSKATDLDKISARLLREGADLIADSFCLTFNCYIVSGIFPDDWKCSKVIPLFKQVKRDDLNKYRTISFIPVVAKVFERIVYDQVFAYLSGNDFLSSQQSGFRHLHSTVTALLEATNNWADNVDVNAIVFLDLKKNI